jgi:hypothetical protein
LSTVSEDLPPGHPHSRYRHLFVVVRLNQGGDSGEGFAAGEGDVMLTKAFLDREKAEEEAARLNDLNKGFWHYFVCLARLVEDQQSD